jgi:uncharacterized protein (TIGR02996 family)
MSKKGDSLRTALEQALVAHPDDLASHMAHADHLSEQSDPRGEFIQVQLALEDPRRPAEERDSLRRREQELLEAHQAEWLGEAAPLFLGTDEADDLACEAFGPDYYPGREGFRFQFVRGWLDSLHLGGFSTPLAEALGRCPTIGLLRQLTITSSERGAYEADPCYEALARWPCLANLCRFQLGPQWDEDQCHIRGEGIGPAIARMSRLELDVLAANSTLGNLITLSCWPHALEPDDEQAYLRPEAFEALVRSPHLKSLMYLELYLSDIGDEAMAALVASGLLGRLRVLDLESGRISDEGARILAACPDVRRLERLRLAWNQLTPVGIGLLQRAGARLEADGQHTAAQIEANEHLWEGDCE